MANYTIGFYILSRTIFKYYSGQWASGMQLLRCNPLNTLETVGKERKIRT